ncbi:hypothetical protein PLICRDRAFT_64207, partial [Plicaturopsis crispa FD-325 SS-3]
MSSIAENRGGPADQFLDHLVAAISMYELGPRPGPVPKYEGPKDWRTTAVTRSLGVMAQRMFKAEEALASINANADWQASGPE